MDAQGGAATSQMFLKSHSTSTPWKVVSAQEFPIWPLAKLGASIFVRTCSCPPPSTSTKTLPSSYLELKIRPLRHQSSSLPSLTSWIRQFRVGYCCSRTWWVGSITPQKVRQHCSWLRGRRQRVLLVFKPRDNTLQKYKTIEGDMLVLVKGIWIRKVGLVTDVTAKFWFHDLRHRSGFLTKWK